jgi:eukaryotic-like serine/threonine-protein kinase
MEICMDRDAALLNLSRERGYVSHHCVARILRSKDPRPMDLILLDAGNLDSVVVRELQMDLAARTIGHMFNGYELISKLGESDMSVVFRAIELATRKTVAIKVMLPRAINDPKCMDRFRREVQAAMAVVHPNVISCQGVGQADDKAYMVFEFMAGGDLRSLIKRKMGPLHERVALPIAGDCARGLMAIHAHGLVHRDIKPSNILLDVSGQAKIADLGLAKHVTPSTHPLINGLIVGSPGYMSPEHAGGLDEPDMRSDIYSLGATIYYLLSGHCPFPGRSRMEVILNNLHHDPLPLHDVAPDVSPAVVAIVNKCMSRLPRDRYRNSTEVRQEIDKIMTRSKAQSSASTNQLWIPQTILMGRCVNRISRHLKIYARKIANRMSVWRHRMPGNGSGNSSKGISILSESIKK